LSLDLTPLAKAVGQLGSAIQEQAAEPNRLLLRAGLIQTFEYTYELGYRVLKRYLESVAANPAAPEFSTFEGVIRLGDQAGLLLSPIATWKTFRQARNDTSHTYREDKALDVLSRIPAFEKDVQFLLARLQERVGP
jgi:nucleotidyltransferase substrate binding protein (TIGR01987 family)